MDEIDLLIDFITPDDVGNKTNVVQNDQTKLEMALAKFEAAKETQ